MNIIKKIPIFYLLAVLMPWTVVHAQNTIPPFALLTIPKAGSHLMIKTLYFLTKSEAIWHTKFPSYQYIPGKEGFLYTHLCLSPQLEADYAELPELKKILLIRDLRDVAISMVRQIKKAPWPGLNYTQRQDFLRLSPEEQLLFVIDFEYDVEAVAKYAPNSLQVSLKRLAEQALRYAQDPSILTIRYEDLVGPNGGGSFEAQVEQMHRINDFLHLGLSDHFLHTVATKIYGDEINPFDQAGFKNFRSTFQVGMVGKWKDIFKEEHKVAFKHKLGSILVDLGYAEDDLW